MIVIAETRINVEMRPATAVERKIGRHHIAFFRAILLGIDMSEMSDRHLETGMDLRRAKATLAFGNLFEWLVRVQYCSFNPWSAVAKSIAAHGAESDPDEEFTQAFSVGKWGYIA